MYSGKCKSCFCPESPHTCARSSPIRSVGWAPAVEAVGSPLFAFNVDPATGGWRASSIPGTIAPRSHALPARTRALYAALRAEIELYRELRAQVAARYGLAFDPRTGGALGGLIEGANRTVYTIVPNTCSLAWRDPDRSFSP